MKIIKLKLKEFWGNKSLKYSVLRIMVITFVFLSLIVFVNETIRNMRNRAWESKRQTDERISELTAEKHEYVKPNMLVKDGRYVHPILKFSLPESYSNETQDQHYYGKRIEIGWPTKDIQITVGYFYGEDGELLETQDVIKAHFREETKMSKTNSFYKTGVKENKELSNFEFSGYSAVRLDMTQDDLVVKHFKPYSVTAIQKGPLVYELHAKSKEDLDKLLTDFQFTDDSVPSPSDIIGELPKIETKNEALLFFPLQNGKIKSTLPTISGKIRQGKTEYIESSFELAEPSPGNSGKGFFLRYLKPGRLKNVEFTLDGKKVNDVFGFAQYPFIKCEEVHRDQRWSDYHFDSNLLLHQFLGFYGGSVATEPFVTKAECLTRKADQLPPVLFYFKPSQPLAKGNHTLQVTFENGEKQELKFEVDPGLTIAKQDLPEKIELYGDACMSGSYYDRNFLGVPTSKYDNLNLFYKLSFPQSDSEKGNTSSRVVQLHIEGRIFDLQFSQKSLTNFIEEKHDIYLPLNNLYFPNGTKANIWVQGKYSKYFEVFPVDITGRTYQKTIPWDISGWSWCDG